MKSAKPRDFKSRYLIVSIFRVTRLRQLCTAIAHLDRAQTRRRYAAPAIIRIFQQPLSRTRRPWFLEAVSTHSQDYHPQNAGAHFPPKNAGTENDGPREEQRVDNDGPGYIDRARFNVPPNTL